MKPMLVFFFQILKSQTPKTLNFYYKYSDPFFPILKILEIPALQINSKFRPSLKHGLLSDSWNLEWVGIFLIIQPAIVMLV